MPGKHISELIARNPVNKGLDYKFVDALIRSIVEKHFPEIAHIDKLNHYKFKKRVGKRNSTFIYNYTVRGRTTSGKHVIQRLIYSSHSDGSRLRAYHITRALIAADFNNDKYKVLEPLEYIPEVQALIYKKVPGRPLLSYMSEGVPIESLQPLLDNAADWVNKFHHFQVPEVIQPELAPFNPAHMNLTTDELLDAVSAVNTEQAKKLKALLASMFPLETMLTARSVQGMVYGDLHPENIITTRLTHKGLTMIDFTDVAWGDQLRDCGAFVQQLHFMGKNLYEEAEVKDLQTYFLESYFKKSMETLTDDEYARINLYQSWNALRGFMYFFFQEKVREQSYGLLEEAWLYLALSRDRVRTVFIKFNI